MARTVWRRPSTTLFVLAASTIAWAAPLSLAADSASLHERVDSLIGAAHAGPVAERTGDAEFARRVYLDLTGRIPPVAELRTFLAETAADKRASLVDRLLASHEYARHMQITFDCMWMERRGDKHVPAAEWQDYLRKSFALNKPLNQLIREILSADGTVPALRPAAKFYLDREAEPIQLTRDISRLFFGMDLQCTQCHDHPLLDDYKQNDFYGLFAFLNRSVLFTPKGQPAVLGEKAEGDANYKSVFDPETNHAAGPHLPRAAAIEEPRYADGQAYIVPPADGIRPVPKHSRREQLAALATDGANSAFNRNLANRLWAMLMGRGIVHPVGLHHAGNPPSHPALLDMLAAELVAMKFNTKAFLRELALSETYQRSSQAPESAEGAELPPDTFAVAAIKPLTAEQLTASMLEATGSSAARRAALESQLTADPRLHQILQADGKRAALHDSMLEQAAFDLVAANLGAFVALFAKAQPQSEGFEVTVHQALFLANAEPLRSWLRPGGGNLVERLISITDAELLAEELYLSILSRLPNGEEAAEAIELISSGSDDRPAAVAQLAWALLASAEFRLNH